MGGRFGKYGDIQRKKRIRTSRVTKTRMEKSKAPALKKRKRRDRRSKSEA